MKKFKEVTEEEFKNFVQSYPNPLKRDILQTGEPPLVTYNDFSLGNWPESVVAKYFLESAYRPGSGDEGFAILVDQ